MRCLPLVLLSLLVAPLAAQPFPGGSEAPGSLRAPGGTHFYGELFGATFLGLSLNVEQPVVGPLAVRGGLGFMAGVWDSDLDPTFIGGLVVVPGAGTYRPEIAATATVVAQEERRLLGGPYLGVRYHAQNGSVFRLGAHVVLQRDEGDWNGGLWPAVSFGGRL